MAVGVETTAAGTKLLVKCRRALKFGSPAHVYPVLWSTRKQVILEGTSNIFCLRSCLEEERLRLIWGMYL